MKNILVTGGAGYIGSHTLVQLIETGYNCIVIDNLSNSSEVSLDRVKEITGKDITFYKGDLVNKEDISKIFKKHKIDAVIHFAGLKAVGESVAKPLEYYENNIYGTLNLLNVMKEEGVKKIIFSSSATVYGNPEKLPLTEDCSLSTTNPYGATKLYLENILKDLYVSDNSWNISILRYFNPVGAHKSGLIGEDPKGIPNNLTPYIAKVAAKKLEIINVFGNDYKTIDGTGVRDYIHITDLANGHLAALEKMDKPGVHIFNLGTGNGYSVLEVIKAFEKACEETLPFKICPRRDGDIAECYANASKAKEILNWEAKFGIEEMCGSLWNWQKKNPDGFKK